LSDRLRTTDLAMPTGRTTAEGCFFSTSHSPHTNPPRFAGIAGDAHTFAELKAVIGAN
jgi:hypothetical protein